MRPNPIAQRRWTEASAQQLMDDCLRSPRDQERIAARYGFQSTEQMRETIARLSHAYGLHR